MSTDGPRALAHAVRKGGDAVIVLGIDVHTKSHTVAALDAVSR